MKRKVRPAFLLCCTGGDDLWRSRSSQGHAPGSRALTLPLCPAAPVETPKRTPNDLQDQYLGLLHPTQDYFVYGYQSNTKVKMVLVTERIEKDSEVKKASSVTCAPLLPLFWLPSDLAAGP